jgi:hypothetical protein
VEDWGELPFEGPKGEKGTAGESIGMDTCEVGVARKDLYALASML